MRTKRTPEENFLKFEGEHSALYSAMIKGSEWYVHFGESQSLDQLSSHFMLQVQDRKYSFQIQRAVLDPESSGTDAALDGSKNFDPNFFDPSSAASVPDDSGSSERSERPSAVKKATPFPQKQCGSYFLHRIFKIIHEEIKTKNKHCVQKNINVNKN